MKNALVPNRVIWTCIVLPVMLIVFQFGCRETTSKSKTGSIMVEDDALRRAVAELKAKELLHESDEYTVRVVRDNDQGEWRCYLEILPLTPDMGYTVSVSDDGQVTVSGLARTLGRMGNWLARLRA